ncbi:MAG: HesA/MoeB/ThiF family protein [Candidatus Norongarragalinales archaeon]
MFGGTRFSRQELVFGAGSQERFSSARAVVVGVGGTGSFSASLLCRAGVGELELVDRDLVEESNLSRQTLFCEDDVGKSKALRAAAALKRVNSECRVRGRFTQLDGSNAVALLRGARVVLDCTDNVSARQAINSACLELRIPWVFCSALGLRAMASTIIPGRTPCFACWGGGESPSCGEGVVGAAVQLASAVQASEALALLAGRKPCFAGSLFFGDLGDGCFGRVGLSREKNCICGGGRGRRVI